MNNDYLFLQDKNLKIPLLAKNGIWKFKLGDIEWTLPDCMERLYAYLIIGESDFKSVSATLRANNKKITPIEIDEFISHFEKTHSSIEETFSIQSVPSYATDLKPLCLPNLFSYEVLLSSAQEQELLDIVKQNTGNRRERLKAWFHRYINRYNLIPRYKRDIDIQDEELAISFCRQHGINYFGLDYADNNARNEIHSYSHFMRIVVSTLHFFIAEIIFASMWYLMSITCINIWPLKDDVAIIDCIVVCGIISILWNWWWVKTSCASHLKLKNHLGIIVLDIVFAIAFALICILVFSIGVPFFMIFRS